MADDMKLQIELTAVNDTNAAFNDMSKALEGIQRLIGDLTKAFDSFTKAVTPDMQEAATAVSDLAKPIGDDTKSIGELTKSIGDISKTADSVGQAASESLSTIEKPIKDVNQATKDLRQTIVMTEDELRKMTDISAFKTVAGEVVSAEQIAVSDLKKIYEEANSINVMVARKPQGHGEEGGLFSNETSMDLMWGGMTMLGAAAPLDAMLGGSIKAFADFDTSMRQVNQEAGLGDAAFKQYEQSIVNLSNQTGISAQELSKGLYNVMARGGIDAAQGLTFLQAAAEGAKAGNTDLNTTTQALNSVMGAYGMSASQAGRIMDILFTATNNGQMHFQDLAKSVGASATTAATAGVKYEELAAAQATLTNVGKNAETASQNLNSLLMGIIAPTAGATKEAKALGIEWDAASLKAHGLTYMINEAIKATHGNATELKKLVPNQRAYVSVLALGMNAHKQYTQTLEAMQRANGATAKALEQMDKSSGDSIEKMKTSLQNAGIEIGMALAPAVSKVSDALSGLAKWFQSLSPSTKEFIGYAAAGAAVLLTLGGGFLMFLSAIGQAVVGFKALNKAFKEMEIVKSIIGWFKDFSVAEDAVAAGEGLMDALNPMGWVVLIGAAVTAAAALIITHWSQIKQWLEDTWNAIKNAASSVWNGIKGFFDNVSSHISNVFHNMGEGIKNTWSSLSSWTQQTATKFVQAQVEAFQWLYNHNYYFKDLVDAIRSAWQTAQQDASKVWSAIKQFFSTLWGDLKKVADAFWKTEVKGWETIWNDAVKAVNTIFTPIENFFGGLWKSISGTASSAWNGIKSAMSGLWSGIVNDAENIFRGLGNFFQGLWKEALQWGENLINMVARGIENGISKVRAAVSSVGSAIKSFLGFHSPTEEGPGAEADQWMPNMMNMFIQGIQANIPRLQSTLQTALATPFQGATAMVGSSIIQNMVMSNANSGYGTAPTIIVYAQGNITRNEKELGDIVSRAVWQKAKMQGKF